MFFLLRCAFWLTIVFHAMSWPQMSQDAGPQTGVLKLASDAAGTLAAAAGTAVTAKLENECLKAPSDCAALAARLPQIVAMTTQAQPARISVPKWPLRLAESELEWPATGHKPLLLRN
jgi:hypothetical protein